MFIKKFSAPLYGALGVYLPLITTNCAVLGVAIDVTVNNGSASYVAIDELELIEDATVVSSPSSFTSSLVAKADTDGDWNGTQAGAFLESSLPSIWVSDNGTTLVTSISVTAGEVIYLGDGTDFEEFTVLVTGTSHTHGQTFTSTFACEQDNASFDVTFDNGANYTTLVKGAGATLVDLGTTTIKELHDASGVVANTGTNLGFKITHKDVDTKTSNIYSALTELP